MHRGHRGFLDRDHGHVLGQGRDYLHDLPYCHVLLYCLVHLDYQDHHDFRDRLGFRDHHGLLGCHGHLYCPDRLYYHGPGGWEELIPPHQQRRTVKTAAYPFHWYHSGSELRGRFGLLQQIDLVRVLDHDLCHGASV